MSTASDPIAKSAINGIRTALGVGGVVSLLVGILILVWPGKTAAVVAAIIAIYAIVGGLIYAGLGIFSKSMGGWARVGHIILGIVFVIFEPRGLVHRWNIVKESYRIWPFPH